MDQTSKFCFAQQFYNFYMFWTFTFQYFSESIQVTEGFEGGFVNWHTYCNKLPTSQWKLVIPKTVIKSWNTVRIIIILQPHAKFVQKLRIYNFLACPLRPQNLINPNFLLTVRNAPQISRPFFTVLSRQTMDRCCITFLMRKLLADLDIFYQLLRLQVDVQHQPAVQTGQHQDVKVRQGISFF